MWFMIYYSLSHLVLFFYSYTLSYYDDRIADPKVNFLLNNENNLCVYYMFNFKITDPNGKRLDDAASLDSSVGSEQEYRLGVTKRRPLRLN